LGFELDGGGTDFEGLGDGTDFEGDGDGSCEAYCEAKVGDTGGAEADFLSIDIVCAGRECGYVEEAGSVGSSSGCEVGFEVADGDGYGGYDRAGGIGDGAGDGGTFALGKGIGGEKAQQQGVGECSHL